MKDKLALGSGPWDEDIAQLGEVDYDIRSVDECRRYVVLLTKTYEKQRGEQLPTGLKLRVKNNSHDFGVYYDVYAEYDSNDEKAAEAAYWLEANSPAKWS